MFRSLACLAVFLPIVSTNADEQKIQINKPAPEFTATGSDGKPFKLTDKLQNGKKNVALMFSRANW